MMKFSVTVLSLMGALILYLLFCHPIFAKTPPCRLKSKIINKQDLAVLCKLCIESKFSVT